MDIHVTWDTTPKSWGAEQAYSVVFGNGVIDDLVTGMGDFLASHRMSKRMASAALGCVGWLTDEEVVGSLLQFGTSCVVVDKPSRKTSAERRLHRNGPGMSAAAFASLKGLRPLNEDGQPVMVGPGTQLEEFGFESIRVAGHGRTGNEAKPYLHAKVLVLGEMIWHDEDAFGHSTDVTLFQPERLWIGSANWTKNARRSFEVGLWIDDKKLMTHAVDFLVDVLALSEPFGSTGVDPEPELVGVAYDDAAFLEYVREMDSEGPDGDED